jgi:hypothetical protein
MWSLTSQRERRTSGPENFQSSTKKDFFNNIRHEQSFEIDSFLVPGRKRRCELAWVNGDQIGANGCKRTQGGLGLANAQ